MASVNLILKDPKSIKETRICAVLTDGRDVRIKFYTDISIKPKHWGKNKTILSANSNAIEYNKRLEAFKNNLTNIYEAAVEQGLIPTKEYILDELKPKVIATSKNKNFWSVWETYIETIKNRYKKASLAKFNQIETHLKEFEKNEAILLEFDTINSSTLERLQSYYIQKANLRTSTTEKHLINFKSFLNWANIHGYCNNVSYKIFKTQKAPNRLKIILSASDIQKIEKAELEHDYLKNARELLILSTLTGLRYSDYSRISAEHIKISIDGSKNLVIRQEKTLEYVTIPLVDKAVIIIDKIIKGELHAISNQKSNDYVKEVCRIAQVDELHEVFTDKGKLTVSTKEPKHKLITTHTGRRTFATNLLIKGVPPEIVMKYTGHKSYTSFKNYVNIPKQTEFDMVKNALLG